MIKRKLREVTKKMNAVVRHIETDDITQTNKLNDSSPLGCEKKRKREKKKSYGGKEELKVTLPT